MTEKDLEIQQLRRLIQRWREQSENEKQAKVTTSLYDEEIIYPNCTVQIRRNSVTGEESVGWWRNNEESEA